MVKSTVYDSDTVRREMVRQFLYLMKPEMRGQTVTTFGSTVDWAGKSLTVQRSNVLWIRKLARHMVWPVELGG